MSAGALFLQVTFLQVLGHLSSRRNLYLTIVDYATPLDKWLDEQLQDTKTGC